MNIKQIRKNGISLNNRINSATSGKPDALYDAASHMISKGGKRLRPYMAIKSCMMLGGKKSDAIPAALAIEMIHNFTLVHDDIMDNDEIRHGTFFPVHKKYGLSGSRRLLFSKAFETVAQNRKKYQQSLQKNLPKHARTYARDRCYMLVA